MMVASAPRCDACTLDADAEKIADIRGKPLTYWLRAALRGGFSLAESRGEPVRYTSGAAYGNAVPANASAGGTRGPEPDRALEQSVRAQVDALYQRHSRAVLGYLCRRLPSLTDAEDILADVFLTALRVSAEGSTPDLPWLLTVARRRAADFYRMRKRRGAVVNHDLENDEVEAWPAGEQDDPEWRALHSEELRELAALVARLPQEQREAIALRFAAELPSAQIAVALGKTDDATRMLLSRAMRRLREEWSR
ncbi:MAG TPA: sigma-70 family RNA polymerase sigma factor [Ktedonobacterales bacterium]